MHVLPQVRGHHVLCLLTYVGRGYSPDFVRAMDALAQHVACGRAVQLCEGPDVLCASLTDSACGFEAHCHLARNVERDRIALQQVGALLGRDMQPGTLHVLTAVDIDSLRHALQPLDASAAMTGLRSACSGCEWLGLCREVTATGFEEARIGRVQSMQIDATNSNAALATR